MSGEIKSERTGLIDIGQERKSQVEYRFKIITDQVKSGLVRHSNDWLSQTRSSQIRSCCQDPNLYGRNDPI